MMELMMMEEEEDKKPKINLRKHQLPQMGRGYKVRYWVYSIAILVLLFWMWKRFF